MKIYKLNFLFIAIILIINGCINHSQKIVTQNGNNKLNIRIIAVLPITTHNTADIKTAQLLRSKLFEEIYFKGYSKISMAELDKKLEASSAHLTNEQVPKISPETLRNLVGADAGLYCSLTENNSDRFFYKTVKVTAFCALRDTANGESLWNAQSECIKRNFNITAKGLKKNSGDDFDDIINEIGNEIVKNLPDGPNLLI